MTWTALFENNFILIGVIVRKCICIQNVINENLKATFLTQAERGGGCLQTISKKWKQFKKNYNFVLQK